MPVKAGSLHEFPARAKGQGIMAAGLSLWAIECGADEVDRERIVPSGPFSLRDLVIDPGKPLLAAGLKAVRPGKSPRPVNSG